MLKFLKNSFATILLALISLAFFALEIFAPFASPKEELFIGYFGLLAIAACGAFAWIDVTNSESWLPFLVVGAIVPWVQSFVWIYLKPSYSGSLLAAGLFFSCIYLIVMCIASLENGSRL